MRKSGYSILILATLSAARADVLLDDTWPDGARDVMALPVRSAWYASSAPSLVAAPGTLTGTTASGTSRSWWTWFTEAGSGPVYLVPGETLRVTLTFIPGGVNASNTSRALRIGLFDFSAGTRSTADGASPSGTNASGYALNLNFGETFGTANPISLRKRTDVASADLMGSAGDFATLTDGDGGGPKDSPGFVSGAVHTLAYSVTAGVSGAEVTATFSRPDGWSITHTATDPDPVTAFDGFGLRPANGTQTAAGFVITRFLVEKLNAVPPGPPVMDSAPQPLTVSAGSRAEFTAAASGTPPLSWQWQRDGQDIPDATGPVLTLTNVQASGSYRVVVTNPHGSTPSTPATLTVTPAAPAITLSPLSQTRLTGDTLTLSAAARGTEPITWQWTRDGQPVPASDAPTLTIPAAQPSHSGSYRAIATNAVGSRTSAPAVVNVVTVSAGAALVAAPHGIPGAPGSLAQPTSLEDAIARVAPGGTVLLRGGNYVRNVQVDIDRGNDGSGEFSRKTLCAFVLPDGTAEVPVLDFRTQPYGSTSAVFNPRGLFLGGDWWHVKGLEVVGAADNGIFVAGNHNIVEGCRIHGCHDTGLQISRYSSTALREEWPSFNLILNCESWDNCDSPPNSGENADGFAAKLTSGDGNVFRGCIAHHNIDDGWDLFTKTETGPIGSVVIDRCISYHNGTLTDGTVNANGDRNGFKLGGSSIPVVHTITRCLAFGNGKNGITFNSNPGAILVYNNLAFDNAEGNFKFDDPAPVFLNNASLYTTGTGQSDRYGGNSGAPTGATNCFWFKGSSSRGPSINDAGLTISPASFVSLTPPAGGIARHPDGSVDPGNFGRPAPGSPLISHGTLPDVSTLPFSPAWYAGIPDIGWTEARAGFALWQEQQFGETALGRGETLPAASPAGDGQPNVLKYLLGLDATAAIPPARLPALTRSPAGSWRYRWFRRPDTTDVSVAVQTSPFPALWTTLSSQLAGTTDDLQEWEAIFPATAEPARFFRLSLTP